MKFAISTSEDMPNGDVRWTSKPSDYSEAFIVLIHNGWTEEQAKEELEGIKNNGSFIIVNPFTQIC